jgi:quinol monooxygenase YgiN
LPVAEKNRLSWRTSVKKVALSVTLKAKLGKEEEVTAFLAPSLVAQEAGTITWYAFRIDQRTFGIFDSFGSDEARQAHLQGAVAAALLGRAEELLDGRPEIRPVDILAEKLPA